MMYANPLFVHAIMFLRLFQLTLVNLECLQCYTLTDRISTIGPCESEKMTEINHLIFIRKRKLLVDCVLTHGLYSGSTYYHAHGIRSTWFPASLILKTDNLTTNSDGRYRIFI